MSEKRNRPRNQSVKIKKLPGLLREVKRLRAAGASVAFTNGCFDLLHAGHLRVFREAKRWGDVLIVGVNSDASARRLKGPSRPLVLEKERAQLLANLELVDYVIVFAEETPEDLIRAVKPDVLLKGADYKLADIVGAEEVRGRGGKVVRVPLLAGRSTSRLTGRRLRADRR